MELNYNLQVNILQLKTVVRDLKIQALKRIKIREFTLMNSGRFVLTQILDLIHWQTLSRLVSKYNAESKVRHFGVRQQLICMAFAQLTWRNGLRDIEACLNAKPEELYHMGFREPVAKSTLADANETRDWRLWEDLAKNLINRARKLYQGVRWPRFLDHWPVKISNGCKGLVGV